MDGHCCGVGHQFVRVSWSNRLLFEPAIGRGPVFLFFASPVFADTQDAGHFPPFVLQKPMRIPDNLKYDDKGLIPAVIQDWQNNEVLMVTYMNAESLRRTVETGLTWFWSRSRQKFWQKGETSGHIQRVKDILYDCDQDTLLIKVEQTGPACHTGSRCCFFRSFSQERKP